MEAVIKEKLPADLPDKRAHCLAGGFIARYCSITEAYLAGAGKEMRDLFSRGDSAEWKDWQADRVGIKCARESAGRCGGRSVARSEDTEGLSG